MMLPQEIEVWYILPAIRSQLCKELTGKLSQKEIARLLGITEPAVSQYIKGKRGSKIKFNQELKDEINVVAEKIAAQEIHPVAALNHLSKMALQSNVICQLHMKLDKETPGNCRVCFETNET